MRSTISNGLERCFSTFEGTANEHLGKYKSTVSLYTVASDMNHDDLYRMDFQTISKITEYEMIGNEFGETSGKCG